MDRERKLELIQRSLGLKHKLKVHESMRPPDTHLDISEMLLAKWELEDEIHAIEEILANHRRSNVELKRESLEPKASDPPVKATKKPKKKS